VKFDPAHYGTPCYILEHAPELSTLAALYHTSLLVEEALLAGDPKLRDPDCPFWLKQGQRFVHAGRIFALCRRLRCALAAYREEIEKNIAPPDDITDNPF
jgi:hypothetical protein